MKQQICNCHKFHTGPCVTREQLERKIAEVCICPGTSNLDCPCQEYRFQLMDLVLGDVTTISKGETKELDSFFEAREKDLESNLKECDDKQSYKLASDPIGSVWFNGIEYVPKKQYPEFRWKDFDGDKFWRKSILDKLPIKPKKPSILQQIKDFIGQIGCDLS